MNEEKIEVISVEALEYQDRVTYDIQITTAKRYPRDVQLAKKNIVAIATATDSAAESCSYALPRDGKTISGPSVHLARIMAQNWGNMRAEARVVEINKTHIVSQAMCFDLETNYAVKVEVRRSITKKDGRRFNEDMIVVTGNAANAISLRNAVFNVVPFSITEAVLTAANNKVKNLTGKSLEDRVEKALKTLLDIGVSENQVFKKLSIRNKKDINQEKLLDLIRFYNAILDGDSNIKDMFGGIEKKVGQAKIDMP